ncbi:hypothetical protein ILYODFUR_009957 [Ilyodon furcidens]|uniref:Uncharacterized protein n=1 Tax=Ilyodon furcidens TaxID=33524 RepID=A0ABV0VEB3_9TELE
MREERGMMEGWSVRGRTKETIDRVRIRPCLEDRRKEVLFSLSVLDEDRARPESLGSLYHKPPCVPVEQPSQMNPSEPLLSRIKSILSTAVLADPKHIAQKQNKSP